MVEKNIHIKMKGGGSRLQRVKVLASGKYKFIKNLVHSKSRAASPRHKTTKTRSVRNTTKRKRSHSRQGLVRGVENIASAVALLAPTALDVYQSNTKAATFVYRVSGYASDTHKWHVDALVGTYGPFVAFKLLALAYHKANGLLRRV